MGFEERSTYEQRWETLDIPLLISSFARAKIGMNALLRTITTHSQISYIFHQKGKGMWRCWQNVFQTWHMLFHQNQGRPTKGKADAAE